MSKWISFLGPSETILDLVDFSIAISTDRTCRFVDTHGNDRDLTSQSFCRASPPLSKKPIAIHTTILPKTGTAPIAKINKTHTKAPNPPVKKNGLAIEEKKKAKKPAPVLKEKKETATAPQPKSSSKQGDLTQITPQIDNQLLQEITESLGAIIASTKMSKEPTTPFTLPSSIEMNTTETSPIPANYGQVVAAILQNSLDLPEFGEVVVKIKINPNGIVCGCEILNTRSRKNGDFLKKRLQELTFPCFNEYGLSENQLDFTITFHNVENH